VREHISDQAWVHQSTARIDALRECIHPFEPCYKLIMLLSEKPELQPFSPRPGGSQLDGLERRRRQISRDIRNVQSVVEAALAFQNLMGNTIEHVHASARHVQREAA
jgi:hypothetical protein